MEILKMLFKIYRFSDFWRRRILSNGLSVYVVNVVFWKMVCLCLLVMYTVHTKSFAVNHYKDYLERQLWGGARGVLHTSWLGTFFLRSLTVRMPFFSNFQKNWAQKMQLVIVVKSCIFKKKQLFRNCYRLAYVESRTSEKISLTLKYATHPQSLPHNR